MRVLIFTVLFSCLFTGAFATQDKKTVKLRVQTQYGYFDDAVIYFDQGVTANYRNSEDVQKVPSSLPGVPYFFSLSANSIECANNGYSTLSQTETIALGVDVDSDAVYNMSAVLIDKFDPTTIVRLEDREQNIFTDLRTNFYQASILAEEPVSGRFFLHVTTPVTFSSEAAGCSNNDGKISVATDTSVQWTLCELYDANSTPVGTFSNVNGEFDFTGLPEGDYTLALIYGSYTTAKQFYVNSHAINANINASTLFAYTGQDVTFHALSNNATQFEWEFGEGTWIVGVANPTLAFHEPGVYNVVLTCTNSYGCSDDADVTVVVSQVSGIDDEKAANITLSSNTNGITVNLNTTPDNAQLKLVNLLGQEIYNNRLNNSVTTVNMGSQPAGYYLAAVTNGGKTTTKKIYFAK